MAQLGDLDHVKAMLRPSPDTELGADVEARLTKIQAAVTAKIERDMGRTFGSVAADTTHLFYAYRSNILILPIPARTITSITVGGTVTGGTVTGGTLLTTADYAHSTVDVRTGAIYALRLLNGAFWGSSDPASRPTVPVVIVGDFTDSDNDAIIPDDVQYIADYLIFERYRYESASNNGGIGPDGFGDDLRDAWKDPMVLAVIGKYRADAYEVAV
jgi:hypothetical protein